VNTLLSLRNLRFSYQRQMVLDIAEFAVPAQGSLLLTGRNGSGKTTLLKILAGLLSPDSLTVQWQDSPAQPWRQAKKLLRQQAVYLHQQPYLFDGSVAENVGFGLRCRGMARAEIAEKVRQALAWAELSHLAERHARCLSGGEKQRVALTRARILSPRLLLLDEPTANMDQESKAHSLLLLQRLQAENISLILTSHELHPELADRHLHLENAKLFVP